MQESIPPVTDERNESPFVITISRQLGSAGRQIGHILAQEYDIAYYDKESLATAAQNTGLGHNVFDRNDKRKGFMRNILGAMQPFIGGGDFYASQLSDENLFKLQCGVIQKVAAERSCVFVGRAADDILYGHQRKVSLFICANMEDRIRRVMDMKKVDYRSAMHIIEESDEQRSGYYNFHARGTWGSADSYDLCLNVSTLDMDHCIELIEQYISMKLGIKPKEKTEEPSPEFF